jgi:hypothetical protein
MQFLRDFVAVEIKPWLGETKSGVDEGGSTIEE